MNPRTLPRLFEDAARTYPKNILIWEKRADAYEGTTYSGMRTIVREFAAGLIALGLGKGDRAALISEGRNDWVMAELGIFYAGAVDVPISVKIEETSDLKFRLAHSGCRMVIVSGNHVAKIRKIKNDLPDLEKTIVLDRLESWAPDEIFAGDVRRTGAEYLESHGAEFETAGHRSRRRIRRTSAIHRGPRPTPRASCSPTGTIRPTSNNPSPLCLSPTISFR